jgi:hypothetical protein
VREREREREREVTETKVQSASINHLQTLLLDFQAKVLEQLNMYQLNKQSIN